MQLIRPISILLTALAVVVITTGAATLHAQGQTLPRFDTTVVVTPARAESIVARVPSFVTLIDEDDIAESPARDIPDLLRQAGLQVTDVTGNGRSYRVDLRGFGATTSLNTLVLVDGRRVNQPDLSDPDWLLIPLEHVARIEVIRGGGAAVAFGDNASGGVVNIITKSGGADETRVAVRAGSYSTITPTLSSRGTRGAVSYAVSGGFGRSDGYRDNAQTKGGGLSGQIVVRPEGRLELGLSGGYHGDKTGLPGSLTETVLDGGAERTDTVTPDDFADVDDTYVMASPKFVLGPAGYASIDVSVRQRNTLSFSTFVGGDFSGDTGIRTVAAAPKIVFAMAQGAATHQIVAGADVSSAKEDIRNTLNFGGFPDVGEFTLKKSNQAFYARDEVNLAGITVTGGYRYDAATFSFEPSTPSERDFHSHAGEIGVTAAINEQASVFASVSRSFRYPVLDELFDFFSNSILTTLEPQASVDVQGGVRIDMETAQASISVFRLSTEDEIFFNRASGLFGANDNLDGTSRRTGLELAASTFVGAASVGGTLTVLGTTIDGGAYDGQEIPGAATRRGSIQLRLPLNDQLSVGVDGAYTGARRFEGDFPGDFPEQDAYFLLDAKLTYQQGRARIFVDLKNLLNEEYSQYGVIGGFPLQRAYYPSPRMHAMAGVDLTF